MADLLGQEEPSLVEFIVDKTSNHAKPEEILAELVSVLVRLPPHSLRQGRPRSTSKHSKVECWARHAAA